MSSPNTYESKKQLLDDMKMLSKEEYYEVFRIIKRNNVGYTENSNGIFFDISTLSDEIYEKLSSFMSYCKSQRKSEEERTQEMNTLRQESKTEET